MPRIENGRESKFGSGIVNLSHCASEWDISENNGRKKKGGKRKRNDEIEEIEAEGKTLNTEIKKRDKDRNLGRPSREGKRTKKEKEKKWLNWEKWDRRKRFEYCK